MTCKILPALLLSALLTACTESARKVPVEERGGAAQAAGEAEGARAFGMGDDGAGGMSPLGDPGSLPPVRVIYFDYDSSVVPLDFNDIIQAHARFLQANPGRETTLEGHADERGSREYNLALGEQRARAVKQQLVEWGVDPAQLITVSYGEERPAVAGHDQEAWRLNRRVEFAY